MFQDHYDSQLDKFKESFLTEAARCGRTEEVSSLIELGARIDWSPENEDTPLLAAVKNNHIDVATILIAHGADVNRTSIGGNNALHLAARGGHEEMCALILSATSGSDEENGDSITTCPFLCSNDAGLTPFDIAVEKGFWALAETLKNLSMVDSASISSDFLSDSDGDNEIRDQFLSRVPNLDEESSSLHKEAVNSTGDLDDNNAVTWRHLPEDMKHLNNELLKLQEENRLLRKAEETYKEMSSDAEKAILILETRCKELENKKKDFIVMMDEALSDGILSQKSLEDIEIMEQRMKQALEHLVNTKVNKLSEQIENRSCVVCQVQNKTVLLMPCRHLCVCKDCSKNHQLILCPLCRERITERIDVYS